VIGPEDGLLRAGPNLLGVTERRERAWLARWLAEPDAMLAEQDPLALQLYAANRNLPMPNMRLNALEVGALLEYMDDESRRVLEEGRDEAAPTVESDELPPCCEKGAELLLGGNAEEARHAAPRDDISDMLASALIPTSELHGLAQERGRRQVGVPTTSLFLILGLLLVLGALGATLRRCA
jgi:hypothetical protein